MARPRISRKAAGLADSVFPYWTRLAIEHKAVNLSQGFPDFPAPPAVKAAAIEAIAADHNQYTATSGAKALRDAIAASVARRFGVTVDPDSNVTVCCGGTEAIIAAMLAVVDPGDEVIVFEPLYEIYGPDVALAGAVTRSVALHPPELSVPGADWTFDPAELAAAFGPKTRAIVINTPNNPTGKVFTRAELEGIAALCLRWDVVAIMDEIYDQILYDDAAHVMMASIAGMADRTVTVGSLSKTFSVTGWRVGWTLAPAALAAAIRKVHEQLTVAPASPMQTAGVLALNLPDAYFADLRASYTRKRRQLLDALTGAGFVCYSPRGSYFVMTDVSGFGFPDADAFARHLVTEAGVVALPGSAFWRATDAGRQKMRFCFCKKDETLALAAERLQAWRSRMTR